MLMNPCRQRRRLRRILEDWHNLFHHGSNADITAPLEEYLAGRGWEWGKGHAAPEIQVRGTESSPLLRAFRYTFPALHNAASLHSPSFPKGPKLWSPCTPPI
jgi:hypothetical protein